VWAGTTRGTVTCLLAVEERGEEGRSSFGSPCITKGTLSVACPGVPSKTPAGAGVGRLGGSVVAKKESKRDWMILSALPISVGVKFREARRASKSKQKSG
jgi:hypothetical protein